MAQKHRLKYSQGPMRRATFEMMGQKNIATRIPPMEPMEDERIAMPSALVASPFCVMG